MFFTHTTAHAAFLITGKHEAVFAQLMTMMAPAGSKDMQIAATSPRSEVATQRDKPSCRPLLQFRLIAEQACNVLLWRCQALNVRC